jgi:hypothetical protein
MKICKLLTLTTLTLWIALAPVYGQTVVWNRQADGRAYLTCAGPPPSTAYWPSNYNWGQYEHWGSDCFGNANTVRSQPSNWSTTNYPDGPTYDVILGSSGGMPTHLDLSVTVHSLTVLPDGGLDFGWGTTLTASTFDFQEDGSIGNSGLDGCLKIADGGSLTKSVGTGRLAIGTSANVLNLIGFGATISVSSGELRFVYGAGDTCWTNFTFDVASNAILSLRLTNNWMC